ncbi:unnamed protein product [Paramecium primaurelia]|uniref:TLDc domain-containing protein n=1 Tax=Paramecium primaurelia TaxID=5886 RepID=A0A8S1QPY4_PARPR|nr:unnamed protein product [Paramecium primaurelia]
MDQIMNNIGIKCMVKVTYLWYLNPKVIISLEHTLLVNGNQVIQDQKQYAIFCYSGNGYGPVFGGGHGGGHDIKIDSNFTDGYCKLGHSYQFSQYKNQNDDPYLFGQNKPEIKECEIYELQFV